MLTHTLWIQQRYTLIFIYAQWFTNPLYIPCTLIHINNAWSKNFKRKSTMCHYWNRHMRQLDPVLNYQTSRLILSDNSPLKNRTTIREPVIQQREALHTQTNQFSRELTTRLLTEDGIRATTTASFFLKNVNAKSQDPVSWWVGGHVWCVHTKEYNWVVRRGNVLDKSHGPWRQHTE